MNIQFYHLLSTPLEDALPKLAAIAYQRGIRVCVVAEANTRLLLDTALWTYSPISFLPHGLEDEHAEHHPILITNTPSTVNHATLLMITNGLALPTYNTSPYERVFDIFNGNDTGALEAARIRWKTYLDAGTSLTYVKQRTNGGWDKLKEANQSSGAL